MDIARPLFEFIGFLLRHLTARAASGDEVLPRIRKRSTVDELLCVMPPCSRTLLLFEHDDRADVLFVLGEPSRLLTFDLCMPHNPVDRCNGEIIRDRCL